MNDDTGSNSTIINEVEEVHNVPDNIELEYREKYKEDRLSINNKTIYSSNNDLNSKNTKYIYNKKIYGDWDGECNSNSSIPNSPSVMTTYEDYSKSQILKQQLLLKERNCFNRLQITMKRRSSTWYRLITFVRYKYDFYQKWNTISSIIVILLSSIITFMEALRSNVSYDNEIINQLFTLFTLSFGFIIALIASIIKFFNFQQQMENLKTAMSGIGHSYEELNRLLTTIDIKIISTFDDETKLAELNETTRKNYEKIATNAVSPENTINNILNPKTTSSYLEKYLNNEKRLNHIEQINKRQQTIVDKMENNLSEIENTILNVDDTSSENIRTNEKIRLFVDNLKNYGKQILEYRKELNKIFKNSLGNYKLEEDKERGLFYLCGRKYQ